jgi:hypothetical protein
MSSPTPLVLVDLGLTRLYIGVEFEHCPLKIWLHQRTYIRKILNMYGMNICILTKILMEPRIHLQKKMGFKK